MLFYMYTGDVKHHDDVDGDNDDYEGTHEP